MQTPELAPAATEVARIVAGVRDDQLTDPTPCPGTSVAGMLDHLVGLTLALVYRRARSLPMVFGMHAAFNAISLLLAFFLPQFAQ